MSTGTCGASRLRVSITPCGYAGENPKSASVSDFGAKHIGAVCFLFQGQQ